MIKDNYQFLQSLKTIEKVEIKTKENLKGKLFQKLIHLDAKQVKVILGIAYFIVLSFLSFSLIFT